jgi:hypothetical protein
MCSTKTHTRVDTFLTSPTAAATYIKYKQAENECRAETFVRGGASIYMQIRGCVTWPDSHFAARHYYA